MKTKIVYHKSFQKELPHIEHSLDEVELYGKDATSYFKPNASLVVFPKDTREVQQIIQWANDKKIPIVPSGGRTGLSGGATAINNEVILSLEKMNRIIRFCKEEQTFEVEAGMITQTLQEKAKEKGLYFPIDFAAVGSSQIGGNIATNAGGVHVIYYGMMRNWVTGLKVITGKGEVLELNKGLIKNNTGYDLKNLFIGSEGTLGVITEATIRVTQIISNKHTFLLSFDDLENVLELLKWFKQKVELLAFEFFTDEALQYALEEGGVDFAMENRAPFYSIIEFERLLNQEVFTKEEIENSIMEGVFDLGFIKDGVVASSEEERLRIWKHRENIPSALNRFKPYKNDVAVRITYIPLFIKSLEKVLGAKYPAFKVLWFGHIGDGNLHLNFLKTNEMSYKEFKKQSEVVSIDVYKIIEKFEGSISAEHGVGLIKKKYLNFTRKPEEITYMKQIKNIFDPNNILNPGKIV